MNTHRASLMILVLLALGVAILTGPACRHSSTNPTNNSTPAPPCDPPASTLIRDGYWQRTQVLSGHLLEFPCAAPATVVDTLLWVGVDFLAALTDGQIVCPPQWACDSRFTIACKDTVDDPGCRYILTAQGSGTFREDSLSADVLVRVRTSGACGTVACALTVRLSAVWIGPISAPVSHAAARSTRSPRSTFSAMGRTHPAH